LTEWILLPLGRGKGELNGQEDEKLRNSKGHRRRKPRLKQAGGPISKGNVHTSCIEKRGSRRKKALGIKDLPLSKVPGGFAGGK